MQTLRRIYAPHAYDTAEAGTYWRTTLPDPAPRPPLAGDSRADVAIIGAGFTGLSAALHLARDHGMAPVVLDAAGPGWGASGRNAGFCGLGGTKLSDAQIERRHGAAELTEFYRAQHAAIGLVRDLTQAHGIDIDAQQSGEFCLAHSARAQVGLADTARSLKRHLGMDCAILTRDDLRAHGLYSDSFHGGAILPDAFGLNPRKYVLGLARAAERAGATIHGQTPATRIAEAANGTYLIETPQGRLRADHLILAANGYNSENLPDWMRGRYLPLVSHIMVTRPLSAAEKQAQGWTSHRVAYDTRNLLHYFRLLPDDRVLFGMRGTSDITAASARAMRRTIRADFDAMFPALAAAQTDHHWSGLICLTRDLMLYAGRIGTWSRAWTGLAYHGSGVAMATYTGRVLAGLLTGKPYDDTPYPRPMQGPLRRFPIPRLRRHYLPLAYAAYGVKDRL